MIILCTGYSEYNESKGNDLADYVDQGGKIIMHSPSLGLPLTGRISDYFPFRVSTMAGGNLKSATYNVNTNHSLFEGVTSIVSCTYCVYRITSVSAGTTILATWNSGQFSGMHFVGIKGNVIGVNLFPGDSYTDDFLRFYSNLLEYAGVSLIDGLNSYEYKFNSQDAVLSLNVSIQNGTTYDSYLNDELVETQNYQNGTIAVNISSIFTDFSYSNFSISNYTKYEFTNVTLAFHTLQNKTFTHFVNVTVYDYIPQIFHNIFDIDHEVATSQILHFNVSDDDLDSLKVYQNNTQLYSTDWNSSNPSIDLNEFLDETFNLMQYNFTLSFIDYYANSANQSLIVNLIDTIKPTLTSFTADNYTEYETDGFIQFQAVDPTLHSYTIAINNQTISSGSISSNESIEISNANYTAGEYDVILTLLDRANNSLVATTSFTVNAYVNPTNTTTTETSTTETSTTTENSTTTDISSTSNDTSSPTISDIITSLQPSDGIGGNITIIVGILGALLGLEFIRRQREMSRGSN